MCFIDYITGVQESYRGRGLGKWLKSGMILLIRDKYPQATYITTGSNVSNAPMLSINDRMGFKVHSKQKFYEFALQDLYNRLKN